MSIIGQLIGGAIGGIKGFATGGFVGAGVGAITGFAGGGGPGTAVATLPNTGYGSQPGINFPFQVKGPGGVPLPGYNPQGITAGAGGSCPRGYHLNRKPLAASKTHGAVPAFSTCVRNRHINPLNARAITRSLRRVKRARKLVSKLQSFGATRRLTSGGHKPGCGCFRCRKR